MWSLLLMVAAVPVVAVIDAPVTGASPASPSAPALSAALLEGARAGHGDGGGRLLVPWPGAAAMACGDASCVATTTTRGPAPANAPVDATVDAIVWVEQQADVVMVRAARRDGAVLVEERLIFVGGADEGSLARAVTTAATRVTGQVPATLTRLATTAPLTATATTLATNDGTAVAGALPAADNTMWWVAGGVGAVAIVALTAVTAYGLARVDQAARTGGVGGGADGAGNGATLSDGVVGFCNLLLTPCNALASICGIGVDSASIIGDAIASCAFGIGGIDADARTPGTPGAPTPVEPTPDPGPDPGTDPGPDPGTDPVDGGDGGGGGGGSSSCSGPSIPSPSCSVPSPSCSVPSCSTGGSSCAAPPVGGARAARAPTTPSAAVTTRRTGEMAW